MITSGLTWNTTFALTTTNTNTDATNTATPPPSQVIVPNLITLAAVLDAVPLEDGDPAIGE